MGCEVIPFVLGLFAGTFLAVTALAIVRNDDNQQVPFLLPGTWRVEIDPTGDYVSHERVIDVPAGVRRLLDEEA